MNGNLNEHEIDPHAYEKITADNIELIKEPRPPEQEDENDTHDESNVQSSGTNGTPTKEDDHIITRDNIDLAVTGSIDNNEDVEDDDDKTSPKKYAVHSDF